MVRRRQADQPDGGLGRCASSSSGSASMRMSFRSPSSPHCCSGVCRRVPTASTASASAHSAMAQRQVDGERDRGRRGRRGPGGGRPPAPAADGRAGYLGAGVLGAAAGEDQRALGGAQQLGGAGTASVSTGGSTAGAAVAAPTGRGAPHTSMAHSSAAGRRAAERNGPDRLVNSAAPRAARGCAPTTSTRPRDDAELGRGSHGGGPGRGQWRCGICPTRASTGAFCHRR